MKKLFLVVIALFAITFFGIAQQTTVNGIISTDILLDGRKVYRNYPKGDNSYKDWDKGAKLISSYTDEESLTLYEDKIKDSILFRKGTNEKSNYIKFWWFELLSPKHSLYIKSKDMSIHVGDNVETLKTIFPDIWKKYTTLIMANEKNNQKEHQLSTPLWFYFYENSKDMSQGSLQIYVKNGSIIRITINFMLEGDGA